MGVDSPCLWFVEFLIQKYSEIIPKTFIKSQKIPKTVAKCPEENTKTFKKLKQNKNMTKHQNQSKKLQNKLFLVHTHHNRRKNNILKLLKWWAPIKSTNKSHICAQPSSQGCILPYKQDMVPFFLTIKLCLADKHLVNFFAFISSSYATPGYPQVIRVAEMVPDIFFFVCCMWIVPMKF